MERDRGRASIQLFLVLSSYRDKVVCQSYMLEDGRKRRKMSDEDKTAVAVVAEDIIRLPQQEAWIVRLERKAEEYANRLGHSPDYARFLDAYYKHQILSELLAKGELGRNGFYLAARERWERAGVDFDPIMFNKAWGIIKDYAETGGLNLRGGTGLPGGR